jgi:hypothetical protein
LGDTPARRATARSDTVPSSPSASSSIAAVRHAARRSP